LNDSFIHKRRARLQTLQRMRKATSRIWLATPYFVPVGSVYRRLVKKAKHNVDVRLMVPQKNDVWFMRWLSWPILHDLAKKGVKIFIYQPRFSHQKIFIIDDWICIGSTNLNHRSFLHDLEMDVVLTHTENKTKVVSSYEGDQLFSIIYDPEEWLRLPRWKRLLSSTVLLAKYWTYIRQFNFWT
jgi:cardiolipin synthase